MNKKKSRKGARRTAKMAMVDKYIGAQLRKIRAQRGYTQETLGLALGISHQQVQKYETGANRLPATRLMEIAKLLGVVFADFFPSEADLKADTEHGGTKRSIIRHVTVFEALPKEDR